MGGGFLEGLGLKARRAGLSLRLPMLPLRLTLLSRCVLLPIVSRRSVLTLEADI